MRAIAVFNNKGGVGKTSLLCNLAAYFAIRDQKKVLVVDADPQCNATQSMVDDAKIIDLYEKRKGFTLWDVLRPLKAGRGYIKKPTFIPIRSFGVNLLPGDPSMALSEDMLSSDWLQATVGDTRGMRTTLVFSNLLSHCQTYDYVFFDMGPTLGAINRAVLVACDFFIIPMSIDIFSLQAIQNISEALIDWRSKLEDGLDRVDDRNELDVKNPDWKLRFAGYVTQQYIYRRDASGQPRAVKAFDRIIKKIPQIINDQIIVRYQREQRQINFELGSVPYLHSLIPLSQTTHTPIFMLQSKDGVVGAHFSKVREFEFIVGKIAQNLHRNCRDN